jgi:hypothetical protein
VVLGHVLALGGAAMLVLIHVALGARLRRALGVAGPAGAAWRWPVDAALGAGTLALVLLAFGGAGLLRPVVVLGVTAVLGLLARAEVVVAVREVLAGAAGPGATPGADPLARTGTALRALAAALIVLLLATALAPPTEWDSLMYHLRIPLWFLEQGRIAIPPDSFHVALVGGAHLATLPLLAAGLVTGPALMQVAALALTLMGTVALARAVGASRPGGWLAVAALIGCPVFALVAITARIDVMLVLTLVAAHLALLAAADEGERGALAVAALLVGAAMAIKPHAGAYAVALVPLGWRAARGMRPAVVAAAVAAVVALPWYVKNQLLTGAPLYPVGAPGWFEPWIAELFGARVRPDGIDASVLRALPDARASFDLLDAFFAPGELTIEGEGVFYALSPLLLAFPLAVFLLRARPQAAGLAAVGVVYAALVVVPFGRINLRYLMPAIPALAVSTVVALESLGARFGARASPPMRRALVALLFVIAVLPLSGMLRERVLGSDLLLLRHAVGRASAEDVWRGHPDVSTRILAPVIAGVHRLVPPDGKVLMLWEARGLPFERETLVDVMLSNWSYVAQSPAYDRCLAGTGITHVLVSNGAVSYYVRRGADRGAFMLGRLEAFRERCVAEAAVVGTRFELLRLR